MDAAFERCPRCGEAFDSWAAMDMHLKTVCPYRGRIAGKQRDQASAAHECHCGQYFHEKREYCIHRVNCLAFRDVRAGFRRSCPCGFMCRTPQQISVHKTQNCTYDLAYSKRPEGVDKIETWQCECGWRTWTSGHLTLHKERHYCPIDAWARPGAPGPPPRGTGTPAVFKCPGCDFRTLSVPFLVAHMIGCAPTLALSGADVVGFLLLERSKAKSDQDIKDLTSLILFVRHGPGEKAKSERERDADPVTEAEAAWFVENELEEL